VIHPFAMLGSPPQHLAHKGEDTRLEIGERNQIREHATMHTGTVQGGGVTRVGSDGLFMVGTHVAHDCVVGDRVAMANNAALGGHVKVGDFVFVGGLAGVHQHTRIGRYAFVGASAMVTKDVIPYGSVWGNHAHLEGLNLVGLKRRGFSRDAINDLRSAYRLMFGPEGTFQERLDDTARVLAHRAEVREIVDFIRADANRPLCLPTIEW
jgi:UDP-N-acetylglucosamine acyltransferase